LLSMLLYGLTLGLGAGVSPGPMLVLVIRSSLEGGFRAGFRVALAPLASDAPVILVCLLIVSRLQDNFLTWLGTAGGLFVVYLGAETALKARHAGALGQNGTPVSADFVRAVTANLLNPHPWLFWTTVGAPLIVRAWKSNPLEAVVFGLGFYGLLVGSKIGIAWLTAQSRGRLTAHRYKLILLLCGLLLAGVGIVLLYGAIGS
jgi:threonine/homoserine/homoserine lactone efflux protein